MQAGRAGGALRGGHGCVPSCGIDDATSTTTLASRVEPIAVAAGAPRVAALFCELNSIARRLDRAVADGGHADYHANSAIGVMTQLALRGPQRPRELVASTNMSSGGLTLLLKRLERDGVIAVERGGLPSDRRAAVASLTPRGERVVADVSDCVERTIGTLGEDLRRAAAVADEIAASPDEKLGHISTGVDRMLVMARAGAAVADALTDPAFPDDPTPATTGLVLCSVAHAGHTRPSDLVPVVALSPSGVTQLLDRIEDAGLIVREAGLTGDQRETTIGLTTVGERSLATRLERLEARAGALATFLGAVRTPLRRG